LDLFLLAVNFITKMLINMMCRNGMETDSSAKSDAGPPTAGPKSPGEDDPMDTSVEETEEDLLKKADSMLADSHAGPPSSQQETSDINTGPVTNQRPESVSSLVFSLKITAFQRVPVPLEKNVETPARTQVRSRCGKKFTSKGTFGCEHQVGRKKNCQYRQQFRLRPRIR
jgi:hypothetical protein